MKAYIAVDGNETGKHLEKYLLSNDLEKIRNISLNLNQQIESLRSEFVNVDGDVLISGGDNILVVADSTAISVICQRIREMPQGEICFSTGIGNSARNAYLALKYAKSIHAEFVGFDGEKFCEIRP